MSEVRSETPATPATGTDSLSSLHKMSRTAGLGTTEYVEVNPAAVATAILGAASILFGILSPILLIIPAVTILVGFMAVRQINRSAGTQTGKGIAALGIGLALLCVAVVGGREALHARQIAKEEGAILARIDALGKDLSQGNFDAAWDSFSRAFKERMKKEEFADYWSRARASPLGEIKAVRSNGIVDVRIDDETGEPYAQGFILFDFAKSDPDRPARREGVFRKDPQKGWVFENIDGLAPAQPRAPQHPPQ